MSEIQKGSIEHLLNSVFQKLRKDEILMRLLTCEPEGYGKDGVEHPHPLDNSIPNIVDEESDEYWNKVDRSIVIGDKISDLENISFCRIYILEGRRRPVFNNTYMSTQEFSIEVYIHEEFEKEYRMSMITDRVNELLVNNKITDISRVRQTYGNPRQAPQFYRAFYNVYEVTMPSRVKGSWLNHDRV